MKLKSLLLTVIFLCSSTSFAGNLKEVYLKELKKIEKVEKSSNKLLTLLRNSSKELNNNWSPELAKEVAIVFNKLLDVDQNYFLVEVLDPVLKDQKEKFMPILKENLSSKNKKLYKRLRKIADRELLEGNG